MRVLFDGNVPRQLRRAPSAHEVVRVQELGWEDLKNSDLLALADHAFDALVSADKDFRDLLERRREIVALTRLGVVLVQTHPIRPDTVLPLVPEIDRAIRALAPGSLVEVPTARNRGRRQPER